ncbi:MAG: DUF4978 domain-containing protein [Bacteroidales bacterium]|nr:DUF4978 domain-containing protein [Bacteroidales bacterium]
MRKLFSLMLFGLAVACGVCAAAARQVVSYVDTSLDGSQKYRLMVDGRPYYMTNIQIRLDKLRYSLGWDDSGLEAIVARAAADGFNTVSIPLMWTEVEPEKDRFDWKVLDQYLDLVTRNGLRMELLWFGQNSVGGVAKMNMRDRSGASRNRVPDYVLSTDGSSEFSVRRDINGRTMDLSDPALRARETHVLGLVMEHIVAWDRRHGNRHPVIGVQIDNEVFGSGASFPNSLVIDYLSDVAGAVKRSSYVVWTRINCVYWEVDGRIPENEKKRLTPGGTDIDFVGLDTYKHHPQFPTFESFVESMRRDIPYRGRNYRMFMEVGAEVPNIAQLSLAALSGNCAFDYYDMCGIDGHGLYDAVGRNEFRPRGPYIEDVRMTNRILCSAMADLSSNANGYGLFVHNWKGYSALESISNAGVGYTPGVATSQGISILRSRTELVLMSTTGGRFFIPAGMGPDAASLGAFDGRNRWVETASAELQPSRGGGATLTLGPGQTALVRCKDTGLPEAGKYLQAEFAVVGGSACTGSGAGENGFAGNGYVLLPCGGAGYVRWERIDGGASGGVRTLRFRYALDRADAAVNSLFVNGKPVGLIELPPTGSDDLYSFVEVRVELAPGEENTVELASVAGNVVGVSGLDFRSGGRIDELQMKE